MTGLSAKKISGKLSLKFKHSTTPPTQSYSHQFINQSVFKAKGISTDLLIEKFYPVSATTDNLLPLGRP